MFEGADGAGEVLGFLGDGGGAGGVVFGDGGVLLGDAFHGAVAGVDVLHVGEHLLGGGLDEAHRVGGDGGVGFQFAKDLGDFAGEFVAARDGGAGFVDEAAGFGGGVGGAFGEVANLVGDDGETRAGGAGAGGFDGGVEGEDARLEGDLVHRFHDAVGGVARVGDLLHGLGQGRHGLARLGDQGAGLVHVVDGLAGGVDVLLVDGSECDERGAGFLETGGLVGGALGEAMSGGGGGFDGVGNGFRAVAKTLQGGADEAIDPADRNESDRDRDEREGADEQESLAKIAGDGGLLAGEDIVQFGEQMRFDAGEEIAALEGGGGPAIANPVVERDGIGGGGVEGGGPKILDTGVGRRGEGFLPEVAQFGRGHESGVGFEIAHLGRRVEDVHDFEHGEFRNLQAMSVAGAFDFGGDSQAAGPDETVETRAQRRGVGVGVQRRHERENLFEHLVVAGAVGGGVGIETRGGAIVGGEETARAGKALDEPVQRGGVGVNLVGHERADSWGSEVSGEPLRGGVGFPGGAVERNLNAWIVAVPRGGHFGEQGAAQGDDVRGEFDEIDGMAKCAGVQGEPDDGDAGKDQRAGERERDEQNELAAERKMESHGTELFAGGRDRFRFVVGVG